MNPGAKSCVLAVTLFVFRSVVAHSSALAGEEAQSAPTRAENLSADGKQKLAAAERDRWFGAGIRLGLFPPVFSALELTVRPIDHLSFSAFGMYLPTSGGLGKGADRFTLGGALTFELADRRRSGWYVSASLIHYEASKDTSGFYETSTQVAATAGYLLRAGGLELQLGAGIQAVSDEAPPCRDWCFNIPVPPVLPAVDVAVRYVF
jgi:hypothetical protein